MPISRYLLPLGLVFALTGCATVAPSSQNPSAQTAPVGAYRDTIALTGRLAVTYHKDNQPQSINGTFNWTQRPGRVEVSLASPLGQTMATIVLTPTVVTLAQAGQPLREASDIDALTAQSLGWPLPVAGLRDWLQGYATDAGGKRFAASPANSSVVTQDGWRLRFVDWQQNTATPMPHRIDASRSTTSVGDELAIRIVIDPAG